jgi:putative RecB family exonuclease
MNELKHLSYSSINTYLSCPAMWKFRYIDKLPSFGNPNLFFGSVWHNTIEEYISVSATGTEALLDIYKKRWAAQLEKEGENMNWIDTYTGESVEDKTYEEGERWIKGKIKTDTGHEVMTEYLDTIKPKARKKGGEDEKPLYVEEFVSLNVPGVPIPIIGFIDVITADDIPTDFKTSGKSWGEKRAADEMQPLFYLAALSQAGIRVPGSQFRHIVFVKSKTPKVQVFTTYFNQMELLWLYRVIEGVWNAIEREAFPVNPTGWLCNKRYCDYWGSCRGKFEGI